MATIVLLRSEGEEILGPDDVVIRLLQVKGGSVKLNIEAPAGTKFIKDAPPFAPVKELLD